MAIESHILIIWEKAIDKELEILSDLRFNFNIKRIFSSSWEFESAIKNLFPFYAHSQKDKSYKAYYEILSNKIAQCGTSKFKIIIFEDANPRYELRKTSSGLRRVNVNIFDSKQRFRNLTGGGHKIHASDNVFEANKDLTILFGKNLNDFYKAHEGYSEKEEYLEIKCTGVDGFTSLFELFYLLNNSIDYCVLRNFECLPNKYTLEGHGDIDLLVEDYNYACYLTGAKAVYPTLSYRVHNSIIIANQEILFDFRFIGDNYYDVFWQKDILKDKTIYNDIIHVPNSLNYFYSLLYHALIQKNRIANDYIAKLNNLAKLIDVDFSSEDSDKLLKILYDFLTSKNYDFTVPHDYSVLYNKILIDKITDNATNIKGTLISEGISRSEDNVHITRVYLNENKIIKVADRVFIENEIEFLSKLSNCSYTPKIISHGVNSNRYYIEIEYLKYSKPIGQYSQIYELTKPKIIRSIITQLLEIIYILAVNGILHRDIRPPNILLELNNKLIKLYVIDFGCAANFHKNNDRITPFGLGADFKYSEGDFSDAFSLGLLINGLFGQFEFSKQLIADLKRIEPIHYRNKEVTGMLKQILEKHKTITFTPKDYLRMSYYQLKKQFKKF